MPEPVDVLAELRKAAESGELSAHALSREIGRPSSTVHEALRVEGSNPSHKLVMEMAIGWERMKEKDTNIQRVAEGE